MTADTLQPDLPSDPFAPSAGAEWAVARRDAVEALDVDLRVRGLLEALAEFDGLLADVGPEVLTDELIDESEIEILDDIDLAAEAFVRAKSRAPEQLASAETIVLSGPEVKRKIRYKQSVMPSVMGDSLFADVKALFEIGDREGALVSLERMVVIAPLTPSVGAFLAHNEARLLDYYQNVFGPFSRQIRLKSEAERHMPDSYFEIAKVKAVVELVGADTSVQDIIDRSKLSRIEACAVVSQLFRSASCEIAPLQ